MNNRHITNIHADSGKVTVKSSFKNWAKWINWALLFTMLAEIAIPYVYGFFRNSFISRIDGQENNFSLYLASTSQIVNVFFYIIKDIFILGIYSYFGRGVRSNNKAVVAASIKNIWLTIAITTFVICCGLSLYTVLHIDNGNVASNVDEAIASGQLLASEKVEILHVATINYVLLIWTQALKMIAISSFVMIMFSGKTNLLAILVAIRLVTWICLDMVLFVPSTTITDLGFLGVATSDFCSELVVSIVGIVMVLSIFRIRVVDLYNSKWFYKTSELYRVASWSGGESLIRNLGYSLVVLMSLNMLGPDEFSAWVFTIGFYWSFLLVPLYAIQEVIIKDVATSDDEAHIRKRVLAAGHIYIFVLIMCWIPFLIFLNPLLAFMTNNEIHPNVYEHAVNGVWILLVPMILYAFSRLWDQYFYASGQAKVIFIRTIIATAIVFVPLLIVRAINFDLITYNVVVIDYGLLLVVEAITIYSYLFIRTKYRKNIGYYHERTHAIERHFDDAFATGKLTFGSKEWKEYVLFKKQGASIINSLEKANRKMSKEIDNTKLYEDQIRELNREWRVVFVLLGDSLRNVALVANHDGLDTFLLMSSFYKLYNSYLHVNN